MNEEDRKICRDLRKMESEAAAEWLLLNRPNDGCSYISHRSWKKPEQLRLAEHYLRNIPHATGKCYEQLLLVMGVPKFVGVIEKNIPESSSDKDLLEYYLLPALKKMAKNEKDNLAIEYIKDKL